MKVSSTSSPKMVLAPGKPGAGELVGIIFIERLMHKTSASMRLFCNVVRHCLISASFCGGRVPARSTQRPDHVHPHVRAARAVGPPSPGSNRDWRLTKRGGVCSDKFCRQPSPRRDKATTAGSARCRHRCNSNCQIRRLRKRKLNPVWRDVRGRAFLQRRFHFIRQYTAFLSPVCRHAGSVRASPPPAVG